MRIALYLHMDGRAEELIQTYKRIFGAEEILKMLYDAETTKVEAMIGKVFHAELKMGDFYLYMTDTPPKHPERSFNLVYETADAVHAEDVFKKLSEDGEIIQEIKKMPYGPKIGFVTDTFGIEWDIVVTEGE